MTTLEKKPKPAIVECSLCGATGKVWWKSEARYLMCSLCNGVGWLLKPRPKDWNG